MARTVDASSYKAPLTTALGGGPIVDDAQGSGWSRLGRAYNSAYEQLRGDVVSQGNGNGGNNILASVGPIAYYRCRTQGLGGLTDEALELEMNAHIQGGGGAITARARIYDSTHTQFGTDKTQALSAGWTTFATPCVPTDDEEWFDLEVDLTAYTAGAGSPSSGLRAVSAYYRRAKTALTAGAYTNGVWPFDLTYLGKNGRLSAPRLHAFHTMARQLYTHRQSQIVATAYPAGVTLNDASSVVGKLFGGWANANVTTARFYILAKYTTAISSSSLDIERLGAELEVTDSDGTSGGLTSSPVWYGPYDLTVKRGLNLFRLRGERALVYSVSGWFRDGTYPDD